jgi:hypothetical protein
MAKGHKTGGPQECTRNKATVRLDTKLAEATERVTADLSNSQVASISPLHVVQYAMRLELLGGHWRSERNLVPMVIWSPYGVGATQQDPFFPAARRAISHAHRARTLRTRRGPKRSMTPNRA